jgi:hypothetical protein
VGRATRSLPGSSEFPPPCSARIGFGRAPPTVRRSRGLGTKAGSIVKPNPDSRSFDCSSATSSEIQPAPGRHTSFAFSAPPTLLPRAPHVGRAPNPCRIRSQVFSTSQRLLPPAALRPCLVPLTPMGFLASGVYSSRRSVPLSGPILPCRYERENASLCCWPFGSAFRAAPTPPGEQARLKQRGTTRPRNA